MHKIVTHVLTAAVVAALSTTTPAFAGSPYYGSDDTPASRQEEVPSAIERVEPVVQQPRMGLYTCSRLTEQRTKLERKNCR